MTNTSTYFFGVMIVATMFYSCSTELKQDKNLNQNITNDSLKTIVTDTLAEDPLKNGEEITKYDNGVVKMRGYYKNGKREGTWMSWYKDGTQWSENFFENGLKNGKTVTYYENGKVRYEGFFKNDIKSGHWKYYTEVGKLAKEENYDN